MVSFRVCTSTEKCSVLVRYFKREQKRKLKRDLSKNKSRPKFAVLLPAKTYLQLHSTTKELCLMKMRMREKMTMTWVQFKILGKQLVINMVTPKMYQTMKMTWELTVQSRTSMFTLTMTLIMTMRMMWLNDDIDIDYENDVRGIWATALFMNSKLIIFYIN